MSLKIGKFFKSALEAVSADVEGRIYPICLKDESEDTLPFVVYIPQGIEESDTKDVFSTTDICVVDVVVCDENYGEMLNLAEKVRAAVTAAAKIGAGGIHPSDITFAAGPDSYDESKPAYFKVLTFTVETKA